MVHDFYNSRYATCFAQLEALRPVLAADIHLHDHVKTLLSEIKTRALVQVNRVVVSAVVVVRAVRGPGCWFG